MEAAKTLGTTANTKTNRENWIIPKREKISYFVGVGLWNVTFLFPALGFGLAALFFLLVKINRKQVTAMIKANLGEITREEAEGMLTAK